MNRILAKETLDALFDRGVRELCVCPGSRNAPWIQLLTEHVTELKGEFRTYYFFEERSASFFALGRIRATDRPVAVLTTSGTAVAELLPATMEAYYSGLPLVLLTADRPRRFRGSGAPQSAEQVGVFGLYCSQSADLEGDDLPVLPMALAAPFHMNVCFEEPTQAERAVRPTGLSVGWSGSWEKFQAASRRPLVIVGALSADEREPVRDFLLRFGAPAYFEGLSGLRECAELERIRIHVADRVFDRAAKAGYVIDGVLRIGRIPTHRLWRDLEDRHPEMPVLSVSGLPFSGLARESTSMRGKIPALLESFSFEENSRLLQAQGLFEADRMARNRLQSLLGREPRSEPGIVHELSKMLPDRTRLFLGNSLPIREWDLAAEWDDRGFEVLATRGVNGIDGQISTFLGLCEPNRPCWGVFGDLTALYDLSGPWALSQLRGIRADIVVINNGGGKIFDRMYPRREFQNPHGLRLQGVAELWGLDYFQAAEVRPEWRSPPAGGGSRLIELIPDEASTGRFWKEYLSS